jgi:hypothetical protein
MEKASRSFTSRRAKISKKNPYAGEVIASCKPFRFQSVKAHSALSLDHIPQTRQRICRAPKTKLQKNCKLNGK